MSLLNQGRNEIRVNNSGAKCLLENWVEERAVSDIDPTPQPPHKGAAQVFKDGHAGLLTTHFEAPAEDLTTVRATYQRPKYPDVRVKGLKHQMMEQAYADVAKEEFKKEREEILRSFRGEPSAPTEADYTTEFRANFNKEFDSKRPLPTRPHDVVYEQPVTFWTEHRDRVTGVSQVKTRDTVFRKNAAFSTPIGESWNQTQPYDIENYPKM